MRTLFSRIFSLLPPTQGFVYVPDAEVGLMKNATAGLSIRNPSQKPPWIVVNKSIGTTLVAKWPGKLWKVETLKVAGDQPSSTAGYVRAIAVRVIGEVPISQLFGAYGVAICRIIEKARTLELNDVNNLSQSKNSSARDAYSRAWSNWHAQSGSRLLHSDNNINDTLSLYDKNTYSPIGYGFTILCSTLDERARAIVGNDAFVIDDEGEQSFAPDWANTLDAFLDSAMAYGAPELLSVADRDLLKSTWVGTFGELN